LAFSASSASIRATRSRSRRPISSLRARSSGVLFFIVLLPQARDAHHEDARLVYDSIGDRPLITSNHVRGETWTFLLRRAWHAAGVRFLDALEGTERVSIHFVDEWLEREAIDWLRRHDEREYSFVDATSFALMRSLGIREALAFDGVFAAAGFVELRPAGAANE
jgi:predicted nucleic acid-binding protein